MKTLAKNWKVILALLMVMAAMPVFFLGYLREKKAFEAEQSQLNTQISSLQATIAENLRYSDIQEQLPDAEAAVEESRQALYEKFPTELREEDQIMYVLYLEELFDTEISFGFGTVAPVQILSDGAVLEGLTLTVNYETTYQGFKEMVDYLATDSRITSIQYATMDYDSENDTATGSLTLLCYIMDSDLLPEYQEPHVTKPRTGKHNILY